VTLVWLAAALAVIVVGLVYSAWLIRVQFQRNSRLVWRANQMMRADIRGDGDDRKSREAWEANRLADFRLAHTISLTRANVASADVLVDLLNRRPGQLEVVG